MHLAIEEYLRIIELKTATLFAVAAELGARLNTAPISQVEALTNFGRHLGADAGSESRIAVSARPCRERSNR